MSHLKLKPLKKGDPVAVAAPSGPFDRQQFLKGVGELQKVGFRVGFQKNIFARHKVLKFLAGDDARRASELNRYLSDDSKAILFARGGFGCQRILPLLKGPCSPKVVVGLSDVTVLLNHLWQKFRLPSLYGPMVAPHLTEPHNVRRLVLALTRSDALRKQDLPARAVIRSGQAQGTLVGGCLSLVASTLGTPWEIETKNTILFLEDTDEQPYATDRLLLQLEQAGKFKGVRGIVFGTFRQGKILFPKEIKQVIQERFKKFKGPVLWGLRFGHCPNPLFIPLGGVGRIQGKKLFIEQGIFE